MPAAVNNFCRVAYNNCVNSENDPPSKRTGRPRAFDRDQALNIALDLFWRHGFEGTSTAQLTAAMGIAPPSLYAAFGSKEGLFREALAVYGERYGGFLNEAMSAPGPTRAAVEQMLLRAARQFANAEHPLGCMVAGGELQLSPANAALATEVTGQRQAAQQAIRSRLEAARKAGELPADTDTATLSAFFAMTIQGMAIQARDGAKPALLKRLAELAMRAWPGR
ncbi:MAG: TetR family transcriptional regulator [Burkholderiales bacterium PBB5]|nr:MAG: TetR family transcriptional regulator [Burkholderiales bacterium PBB5]